MLIHVEPLSLETGRKAEELGQSSSMTSCKENPFFQGSQLIPESLTEFSVDVFNRDVGISEAEN